MAFSGNPPGPSGPSAPSALASPVSPDSVPRFVLSAIPESEPLSPKMEELSMLSPARLPEFSVPVPNKTRWLKRWAVVAVAPAPPDAGAEREKLLLE
ncbi:hypothetical protein Cs308_0199 [Candidatus Chlamydia sanziniae]|uniref:Uncharacterized protein n=1 Tax=Candidatus Chlamydia sanziniae TaxID=1806891 RepID=A0A1A9HTP8_9CHLA|nr:hypothetical protein Cs308_0199 [Candidatus Chlamydia sanziniae]